jgi:hypothetical protein
VRRRGGIENCRWQMANGKFAGRGGQGGEECPRSGGEEGEGFVAVAGLVGEEAVGLEVEGGAAKLRPPARGRQV